MSFGKHFESMYSGSMIGAGAVVFAVWGYVIAHHKPDWKGGYWVEINPRLLSMIIGEDEPDIEEAVKVLCAPDPKSRTKTEGGRRLIKEGEYLYRVVNAGKYRNERRDPEMRRKYQREYQREYRSKKGSSTREREAVKADSNGDSETFDRLSQPMDNSADAEF